MRLPLLVLAAALAAACSTQTSPPTTADLERVELGEVKNLHAFGDLMLAGQPSEADFELLAARGVVRVVDLRTEGELGWDEPAAVEAAGMQYTRVPFKSPEQLDDAKLDELRQLLRESGESPTLLHCASANRVGAVWLAWRALDGGVELDAALPDAREIGLRSDALLERVRAYVAARR